MSAACQYCDDTGSLSKTLEGDLDCARCDVATERTNFESLAAEAGLLGGSFINAWMIYEIGKAAALEQAAKALPLMHQSFTTAESCKEGYFLKFKFPTLQTLIAAHNEWVEFEKSIKP